MSDVNFNSSSVSDAAMRKIKKILALAERGVDGEREAAQSMLANLLVKHNLTIEDIAGEGQKREWVELSFSGEQEETLLNQIVRKVRNDNDLYTIKNKRVRTKQKYELSAAEHVEVEFLFSILKNALGIELDKMVTAFIYKNKLFAHKNEDTEDDEPDVELTPEQRARAAQIMEMMLHMPSVNIHKAIAA